MSRWEHICCGFVAEGKVPPADCEFCLSLSRHPKDTGWRRAEPLTKAQKREAKKRNAKKRGKISKTQRERIYERDGWECVRCGEDDRELLTLDHIIPVSRGGTKRDDNLQTMCKRCNNLKGNKTASNGMRWPPAREMRRRGLVP